MSLPERLLLYRTRGGVAVPWFLDASDHPWLRNLLDERERFVGRRRRELDLRLRAPLAVEAPDAKVALAARALRSLEGGGDDGEDDVGGACDARRIREVVFGEASRTRERADLVLSRMAPQFGTTGPALREALFADLPGERPVPALREAVGPAELALRANLALAQGLLHRAVSVHLEMEGNARDVVRTARLRGLICAVTGGRGHDGACLDVSGPYALFGRTLVYGRALASVVPTLAWCRSFRLQAPCMIRGRQVDLVLATGDPFLPGDPPRRFDSRLEERFARDFARLAPDWDVVREPEPVVAGSSLVFPDFALVHRLDPRRRWRVEIVGYWTPEYVERKLASYRSAGLCDLVLCIDEERAVGRGSLPAGARVVSFRRRVDAAAVLAAIGG